MTLSRRGLLALLCIPHAGHARSATASPTAGAVAPLLELARDAPPGLDPAGWLVSEKYDGVRAHWDGRVLRSRSGRVLPAPAGFLAVLPPHPLDGELWRGRGQFQSMAALALHARAPDDWPGVRFQAFDSPGLAGPFSQRLQVLQDWHAQGPEGVWAPVLQQRLADAAALRQALDRVVAEGGEGLVLHRADALWQAGRSGAVYRLKPQPDAEAVVIGHLPGQGRFAGMTGALQVRDGQGRTFALGSGLDEALRRQPPPAGTVVSYRYRGLTAHGLPRQPTFWRLRPPGV